MDDDADDDDDDARSVPSSFLYSSPPWDASYARRRRKRARWKVWLERSGMRMSSMRSREGWTRAMETACLGFGVGAMVIEGVRWR